jgi:hypothetical protein
VNAGRLLASSGLDVLRVRLLIHPIQPESVEVRPAPALLLRVWGRGIRAMTLRNRVYVDPGLLTGAEEPMALLLVHELVHVRQWHDLGVIGFLRRYLSDYLRGRLAGLGHRRAYLEIGLEREARRLAALFE